LLHKHSGSKSRQQSTFTEQKMATMDSPSAERNKDPIWSVLSEHVLPTLITNKQDIDDGNPGTTIQVRVLEIAAGAGVHSLFFSEKMNQENIHFQWVPSEPDYACRLSIQERIQSSSDELKSCISSPIQLTLNESGMMEDDCDLLQPSKYGTFHIMTCINMIHISPWSATIGLFKVSSQFLADGGLLLCYGPYKVNGTAVQSNLNFDEALKSRDSSWGVRDLEDVEALANSHGLVLEQTISMPANNLSLIFRKKST